MSLVGGSSVHTRESKKGKKKEVEDHRESAIKASGKTYGRESAHIKRKSPPGYLQMLRITATLGSRVDED